MKIKFMGKSFVRKFCVYETKFYFILLLLTFILEISRLKRQKSFVVDLYQQKLNQIIDVENKLDNEVNKWQTYRL